jgi:hypothetical protein
MAVGGVHGGQHVRDECRAAVHANSREHGQVHFYRAGPNSFQPAPTSSPAVIASHHLVWMKHPIALQRPLAS